ncbi:uncharacterized protein LAJ45_03882 [Morchella importuna]|uniref:uncharacterized protein n=1 Tax=Morchella importuna TaxID=1174673 RepID=UPI001E8E1F39|nr:uncharacterized protein LAJ45_03882 [Morchella importuna]KAH8151889.1 hypothetical protein LAJ45_03882 [Morchella importuna]
MPGAKTTLRIESQSTSVLVLYSGITPTGHICSNHRKHVVTHHYWTGASSEQAVLLSDGTAALETGISRAIVTQLAYGRVHTTALGNIVYHSLSSRINPQIDCWVDNVPPAYSKCKYI